MPPLLQEYITKPLQVGVKCALIVDTLEIKGQKLLWAIANAHLQNKVDVYYATFSYIPDEVHKHLQSNGSAALSIRDYYSDSPDRCFDDSDSSDVLSPAALDSCLTASEKLSVVVDSLQDALRHTTPCRLIRSLQKLKTDNRVAQVVLLGNADLLLESHLAGFKHISDLWLLLQPTTPPSCSIHLKKGSKFLRKSEEFQMTGAFQLGNIKTVKEVKPLSRNSADKHDDPLLAMQTTFSLALTESQKVAKNSLNLPFMRVQQSGGQIHYIPDEADDWDDDDPDDDLGI